MKVRSIRTGMIAVSLVGLMACDGGVTQTERDESFFRATIEGAVNSSFEGAGQFASSPGGFFLFSEGRGAAAHQTFQLHNGTGALPVPGTYTLRLGEGDFQATFLVSSANGSTLEGYAAYEGVVEITSSSATAIEGTFRMSAFRMIHRTPGGIVRTLERTPESPTIEVSGTFSAVPTRAGPPSFR